MFLAVKLLFSLISAWLVWQTIRQHCNKYLAFVVVAIWLRFFLSAFHQITYDPLIAGFSINALASIGIAATGLLMLPPKVYQLRVLLPLYAFFVAVVASGVINGGVSGLINVMVKWMFFLSIACAMFMAIRKTDKDFVLKKLLVSFFLPVSLAVMSVLLGEVKATEADGSASYIGGYNHEAAFSMIIAGFILVVGLLSPGAIRFRGALFALGCVVLVLVNYRTSVLAILPLAAIFAYTAMSSKIAPRYQTVFFLAAFFGMGMLFLMASYTMQDRFADVFVFLTSIDDLIKAPFYYSEAEKDIFSARVYLWSLYIYEYVNGSFVHQLVGWGPESWSGVFPKYAHNTYVSYLYEYGLIGLLTFLFAAASFVVQAMRIKNKQFAWMLCSSMVGFLIMNFATMPLWNIEGLILFAILIGNAIGPVKLPRNAWFDSPAFASRLAN
ncbi:MAG: O-antigen ligase family protein [Pseudomonadota bacterium]|nr:O-antigen ligase family protein [Pseudomonadota bacterium]